MRKLLLNLTLVTALLLAACSQASPTPGAGSPTATSPAASPAASLPATAEQPASTKPTNPETPLATANTQSGGMECQVVSLTPTQGPTEASMFPPPGKDDWVLGKNPSAPLTITEYSDFQ